MMLMLTCCKIFYQNFFCVYYMVKHYSCCTHEWMNSVYINLYMNTWLGRNDEDTANL